MDDAVTAIRVTGLRVSYGDLKAVRGIDLAVETGEVLALLGPNGAGKTSTVEVLELVGLTDKADARVRTLSGGQRRRLDVGLGIVGTPELVFLDEPTTGFDPSARREAWDLVRMLTGTGTTVLLTTHYMDEAQALADRVVIIAGGQVVAEGTPDSLGGRDTSGVVIRFGAAHTPPVGNLVDGHWEVRTTDEVRVLHQLTAWSLDTSTPLIGLTVARPSLEDVYLALTS